MGVLVAASLGMRRESGTNYRVDLGRVALYDDSANRRHGPVSSVGLAAIPRQSRDASNSPACFKGVLQLRFDCDESGQK